MKLDQVYFINLDRRKDRLDEMTSELKRVGLLDITTRFSAVDGKELSSDEIEKWTSGLCTTFCTKSLIGCAMSHMKIWKEVHNSSYQNVLILEDDAQFKVDNLPKFLEDNTHLIPKDFDIIYLGCFAGCSTTPNVSSKLVPFLQGKGIVIDNPVKEVNELILKPFYPVGLHGYIVSKKGVEKLLQLIPKINNHIDLEIANMVFDNINLESDSNSGIIAYSFKDLIVFQEGSILTTDNANHHFPIIINTILDRLKTSDGHTLGYLANITSYQIPMEDYSIPLNLYVLFTFIFGIILAVSVRKVSIKFVIRIVKIFLSFAALDLLFGKSKNVLKSVIMIIFLLFILVSPSLIRLKM